MREDDSNVVAAGCTNEAVVFFGCTTAELVVIVIGSTLLWGPILFLVGVLIGSVLMCIGFTLVFVGVTAVVCGHILQNWKRGRPLGYYQQIIRLKLGQYKLVRDNFVTHDGQFGLGRSNKVVRSELLK